MYSNPRKCLDCARFRVMHAIRKIAEVGVLWMEVGVAFGFAEIDPPEEVIVRKRTNCKAFRPFLIWRYFLQNEEKMKRKPNIR